MKAFVPTLVFYDLIPTYFYVKIQLFKSDQDSDPDPHWFSSLAPDPHCNQCGSTTLRGSNDYLFRSGA
jgi:hypothetical protein